MNVLFNVSLRSTIELFVSAQSSNPAISHAPRDIHVGKDPNPFYHGLVMRLSDNQYSCIVLAMPVP